METKRLLVVLSFAMLAIAMLCSEELSTPVVGCTLSTRNKIFLTILLMMTCAATLKFLPVAMLSVDRKCVFITGCDTGFGHQLARQLDRLGFIVFAGCLLDEGEGAQKLKANCSKSLKIVPIDVTSDDSVLAAQKVVEDNLPDKSKGLWAIVNNAGIWRWGEIEWASLAIFKQVAEVNVFGMVRVTKAFLPLIRQAKGRVVNIGSMSGLFTVPAGATYCMSKYAIECFNDTLRYEMFKWGVKVCLIQPGWYARATGIAFGTEDVVKQIAKDVWNGMSETSKRHYGRAYFDGQVELLLQYREKTSADSTPVIRAMTEAILAKHPKHRYLVGEFFNTVLPCYIFRFLPSWWTDNLFYLALSTYLPKTSALEK